MKMTWEDAHQHCLYHGADLASITSRRERDFAWELLSKVTSWIGGNDRDTEGVWTWNDGTPWNKEQLTEIMYPGEPNNLHNMEDCLHIRSASYITSGAKSKQH